MDRIALIDVWHRRLAFAACGDGVDDHAKARVMPSSA
jgi:hypothetical protein